MSDTDEPSASKRPHDSEVNLTEQDDDGSSDAWVGPLPTDAAPVKKRKSIKSHFHRIQIVFDPICNAIHVLFCFVLVVK